MDRLNNGSFIWLEAICAERNVARRYTIALSRDMFDTSIVAFAWGRIGARGRVRAVSFATEDEATRQRFFEASNWLSNRIFKSYDDIVDHCCEAWNTLVDQPWHIMTIGRPKWARRS